MRPARVEPGLEFDAGHERALARDDVAPHQRGGTVGAHPGPVYHVVLQVLFEDGGIHQASGCGIARAGLIVGHSALSVAAVAVEDRVHVHRPVEFVFPDFVPGRPHGDRLGPAIGVELDVDDVPGGSAGRRRDLESDRLRGAGLPGDDFLLNDCPVRRDDHLPQLEAAIRFSLRVPNAVAQRVFVADIRPDGQVDGVVVQSLGNGIHNGHAVCQDAHAAAQIREGVAQLQQVARQAHGRAGLGVLWHVDGERDGDEYGGFDPGLDGRGQSLRDGRALLEGGVAPVQRVRDHVVRPDGNSLQGKSPGGISERLDAARGNQQVWDGRAVVRVDGGALHASRRAVKRAVRPGGDQVGRLAGADNFIQTIANWLVEGVGFLCLISPDSHVAIFHHRVDCHRNGGRVVERVAGLHGVVRVVETETRHLVQDAQRERLVGRQRSGQGRVESHLRLGQGRGCGERRCGRLWCGVNSARPFEECDGAGRSAKKNQRGHEE